MDEPTYSVRASIRRKETTYRAGEDALIWGDAGAEARLRYADVRKIHIYRFPDLRGRTVSMCGLWPPTGRATKLMSRHYVSFGRFDDRSAAFWPFVAALTERIANANRATVFMKGMPAAWYMIVLVFTVLMASLCAIMVVATLALGQPLSIDIYVLTGIALMSVVVWLPAVLRNRPRRIDPLADRADLF